MLAVDTAAGFPLKLNYEVMGWEGLRQVALTSRKHEPDLWHLTVGVKPDKHDFKVPGKFVMNNLYLPDII